MAKDLPGTQQERTIGWDVRFEDGKWKEYFDTRIPPGESFRHSFRWTRSSVAQKVRLWITVYPDHFYHARFYPAYLRSEDLSPEGRRLVQTALRESGRTRYLLFDQFLPLDGAK